MLVCFCVGGSVGNTYRLYRNSCSDCRQGVVVVRGISKPLVVDGGKALVSLAIYFYWPDSYNQPIGG